MVNANKIFLNKDNTIYTIFHKVREKHTETSLTFISDKELLKFQLNFWNCQLMSIWKENVTVTGNKI